MAELFKALTVEEARLAFVGYLPVKKQAETVPLLESLGCRLAAEVRAAEDVPGFDRSTVDGYAVRARDTYGATEGLPAYVDICGEVLMGQAPIGKIGTGQAWRIATGGMLPGGADAVVMVEYTEVLDESVIGITRPVAPGENVVRRGEDISTDEVALPAGHRVRPQDLGMLSSIGISRVEVVSPCKVGIISSGDELVEPSEFPSPGKVRDINSYTLAGAVTACGGKPYMYGIIRDEYNEFKNTLERALEENDLILLSGGSSVGTRDVAARVLESIGQPGILFHGLSIKPGKPAIGAFVKNRPVFGLPGHPTSAMVVFDLMVAPLIRSGEYTNSEKDSLIEYPLLAEITRNLHSAAGREDFIRVRLVTRDGRLFADPVLGKSGLINTMVKADGLAHIPAGKEGVEAGELLRVKLI
ncbi:MAG: Molybdopterin molybdenumtransferase [Pelotomaculum sp. PtaB.Bin104]|nr:MAG: Molybdopterin molybdenumtransferase [Pelotomaculum sp. PtaB.Bin104]